MKIYLPNESRQTIGGGWSWMRNFKKCMQPYATDSYDEADIVLIAGASLCKPEVAEEAKRQGKRVVLRVDNVLKHSRNQGKGMERMRRMAAVADLVVYQCQWSQDLLHKFLGFPYSRIIYNGVDTEIFKPEGDRLKFGYKPVYLYAAAAKGENKGWNRAYYRYMQIQSFEPNALLLIAGQVSTEVREWGFDFFNDENYKYLGMMQTPQQMATVYRSADYFFAVAEYDCYSNAFLEAAMCGAQPFESFPTGGVPELFANLKQGREFNGLARMADDYYQAFRGFYPNG